jgi:GntR family transcriptional regulator
MPEPLYRQIAEDLRQKIDTGELPDQPDGPLPSEAELKNDYGASRNTVRDAVKWLINGGLIETRPGQGTFVVPKVKPFVSTLTGDPGTGETGVYIAEVTAGGRKPETPELHVAVVSATADLADALRVGEGAQLVSRHEPRFIDGTPWSRQTSFYPMALVDSGARRLMEDKDIEEGAVAYIAKECGIQQAGYRDTIAVRVPDDDETAFFKLPPDGRISVFEIYRIAFDQHGERFRLTITVYPSDRNRFVINVGEVPGVPQGPATGEGS